MKSVLARMYNTTPSTASNADSAIQSIPSKRTCSCTRPRRGYPRMATPPSSLPQRLQKCCPASSGVPHLSQNMDGLLDDAQSVPYTRYELQPKAVPANPDIFAVL